MNTKFRGDQKLPNVWLTVFSLVESAEQAKVI